MTPNSKSTPRKYGSYLPRLPREYYQGDAVVFWTLTLFDRATGWLTADFHHRFENLMLHTDAREGLACPIYCLMPDHIHLIWMGHRRDSDQINGMAFLRTYLEPALEPLKFQPQPQDNVLREDQRKRNAFAKVCFYIAANPVRAGLISETGTWPFTGSIIPGYPKLNAASNDFWPTFWRIFAKLRQPDAGDLIRPPIDWAKRQEKTPYVVSYREDNSRERLLTSDQQQVGDDVRSRK